MSHINYPKSAKAVVFEFILRSVPSILAICISIYSLSKDRNNARDEEIHIKLSNDISKLREENSKLKNDFLSLYGYLDVYLHQESNITLPTNFPPTHIGSTAFIVSVDSKKLLYLFHDEFSVKKSSDIVVIIPTSQAPKMPTVWSRADEAMKLLQKLDVGHLLFMNNK